VVVDVNADGDGDGDVLGTATFARSRSSTPMAIHGSGRADRGDVL